MLQTATAGLQGYCPVCLLPCIATKHAACQVSALPAHSRDKASLQNAWHCHECNRIAEHSSGSQKLSSGQQQQHGDQFLKAQLHGAQLLKADQSVGDGERQPLDGANGASDNVVLRHAEAHGGPSAQGGEAATLTQKQQQQQQLQQQLQEHRDDPISGAEAAEAGKEVAEAWVTYFPIASCTMYCLSCIW